MKIFVSILALLCCSPAFALAHSQAAEPVKRTTVVRFADLDLAHDADVAQLYERIHRGARRVCTDFASSSVLSLQQMFHDCVDRSVAQAVSDFGHPELTAYAQTRFANPRVNRRVAVTPLVSCLVTKTRCE